MHKYGRGHEKRPSGWGGLLEGQGAFGSLGLLEGKVTADDAESQQENAKEVKAAVHIHKSSPIRVENDGGYM